MTGKPSFAVDGVHVVRSRGTILHGVSCTVPAGAVTGLIGPNGSGKTTLLSLLARWARPDAGRVLVDGVPVGDVPRRDYARLVATVEQQSVTELELTVRQIVDLGVIPHRGGWGRSSGEHADLVELCMRDMGVERFADRTWQTLSGGERQRTQVARALAQRPRALLLDEPTNHLDPAAALDLLTLVRRRGLTTVAALHDLPSAAMFCDHLIVLDGGHVAAQGTPAEVLTAELLAAVYGLDAEIGVHPRTGTPLVIPCGTVDGSRR